MEDFIDYRKGRDDPYVCPVCGYASVIAEYQREHLQNVCWKHVRAEDLEYELVRQRYPGMDIDDLILRYLEKEETMITLLKKKILTKKFFETIGILRTSQVDKGIMSVISRRKNFFKTSPEHRFEVQYLPREINKVIKLGLPELIPAVTALKTVKFKLRQAKKAKEKTENT